MCTSGSVVEYRLAKARVAGSNPVSCFVEKKMDIQTDIHLFLREARTGFKRSKRRYRAAQIRRPPDVVRRLVL